MTVYRGDRTIDGIVVTRDGDALPDMAEHVRYSDIGMDWGFVGDPCRQLAFALLFDHMGDVAKAKGLVDVFSREIVCELDNEWELSSENIGEIIVALNVQ